MLIKKIMSWIKHTKIDVYVCIRGFICICHLKNDILYINNAIYILYTYIHVYDFEPSPGIYFWDKSYSH